MKLWLLLFVLAVSLPLAMAQSENQAAEQALLRLANQARADHGLPALRWDDTLARAARAHLQWIVREPGELLHQYPGEPDLMTRAATAGARFSTVSENLAQRGEDPVRLQQKWMSTPTHRANLLDPKLDVVGIAVVEQQGLLYAVEDFARYVPVQQHDDIERRVAQMLQAHGIAPAESNEDARQTCGMSKGASGSAKLVIQWDGPEPTELPDVLLRQLASGRYTSAEVGVCAGQQGGQFTTYHVAVLLY
jgi:Cysteine-rich secretory protein family